MLGNYFTMDKPDDLPDTRPGTSYRVRLDAWLRRLPLLLSGDEAPVYFAALGIACGLLTGAVILGFRFLFEYPLGLFLPNADAFEGLSVEWRLALPIGGALSLGLAMQYFGKEYARTGLVHAVFAVHNLQGRFPWQNAVVQFLGGLVAMVSGQSVGREGPAVHLGAATASIAAQRLNLPDNSLRVLAGCGCAAAIAACFNTPIAGVIFAMEVVLMEYTLTGFIPIILAAVSGSAVTRIVYGSTPLLAQVSLKEIGVTDLLWVAVLATIVAAGSATFVTLLRLWLRLLHWPLWARLTLAGIVTGVTATALPEVLGLGYDTAARALLGEPTLLFLAAFVVAKLITSSASVSLGIPGGMIGPSLVMGACLGSLVGQAGHQLAPGLIDQPALYVILGMAAMMAATLNAPLAALMTLLELTYSPAIMFPGLLAIAVASLVHRSLFRQPSAVSAILDHMGIELANDPLSQLLQRRGVASEMQTRVAECSPDISARDLDQLKLRQVDWLVFTDEGQTWVARAEELPPTVDSATMLDLRRLPGSGTAPVIRLQSSLREAWQEMLRTGSSCVVVRSTYTGLGAGRQLGVITRAAIERRLWQGDKAVT